MDVDKGTGGRHVEFVCVRGAHYRHAAPSPYLGDVDGWRGYCPAGDIGGHDWMSTSTDLATLRNIGYCWSPASQSENDAESEREDATALIRS